MLVVTAALAVQPLASVTVKVCVIEVGAVNPDEKKDVFTSFGELNADEGDHE